MIVFALLAVLATGCESRKSARGRGDAPVGPVNTAPGAVMEMPDQFPNVAVKCQGPNGVYVVSDDGASAQVVPNDPNCRGGG